MSNLQTSKLLYFLVAALWLVYCLIGTLVGINYHTDWPIAPQVWEGIGIAILPTFIGYLALFHLVPWPREFFRGRSLF
jgi:hypothetical protein